MQLTIEIESVNEQLIRENEVKMCPSSATESYKVEGKKMSTKVALLF